MQGELYLDENVLISDADRFLDSISGVDQYEKPKASILIRVGGADEQQAQEFDLGPAILSKRNMQGCYILDLQFESLETLKKCNRAVEEYAKYVNILNGDIDSNHVLSIVLMENEDYMKEYVIAQMPVFFAVTAKEPGEKAMTYRFSFRKDTLFYFDINRILVEEDEENKPFIIQ